MQNDSKPKGAVVELNSSVISEDKQVRQKWRPNYLLMSFIVCFVFPVLFSMVYFVAFATDRYTSTAGFSIRGFDSSGPLDGLGALTGLASSGSTTSDSYIVLRYLESSELLHALDEEVGLRKAFSNPDIDYFSRMSEDAQSQDFLKYWQRRLQTQFDPTSGIIEFTVQSFSPEHAQSVTSAMLTLTQELVNNLSVTARNDALRYAQSEVAVQEERLRLALEDIRGFRSEQQELNPLATATLDVELLSSLEAQIIAINSRIFAQEGILDADAPSLIALRREAAALQEQIDQKRQSLTGSNVVGGEAMNIISNQLTEFEELEIERQFAQQSYASSLASLEQARRDADQQQRYLAVFLHPQASVDAVYPKRALNIFIIAFAAFSIWSIGALLTYSIRDHLT